MKTRCSKENAPNYKHYGGKGISVCSLWDENYIAFRNWAISNGYNENLTLDRIDNNGNYEPSNCRWVTMKTQANNRETNICYDFNGEKLTLKQISEKYNVSYCRLCDRIRNGWDIQKAVYAPIDSGFYVGKPVIRIEDNKRFESTKQAGEYSNCSNSSIVKCCKGKIKSAGGFHWKYVQG